MCDNCGEVLKGHKGTVFIQKDCVAIRGMITFFTENDYTHITNYAQEELSFCNTDCFKEFCNRRIQEKEARRQENLREEARQRIIMNGRGDNPNYHA